MSNQRVAILGYNREGRAALDYFRNQGSDCTVFYYKNPQAAQNSPIRNLPANVELQEVLRNTDFAGLLDNFDLVVRTADILPHRIKTTAPITSNTIEFFTKCPAPIIGVTGTKGKSTTSSLIAEFLKADGKTAHLIGNIGDAPLESLGQVSAKDWVVFELSSFQLADIKQSPHIAVHLMIEPDHLDIHPSVEGYMQAKANIFCYQKPDDVAVFYAGDEKVKQAAEASQAKTKIPFDRGSTDPAAARVEDGRILVGEHQVAKTTDVKMRGAHVLDNVCAACAAVFDLVDGQTVYSKVLSEFGGLPHRLQTISEIGGVEYVDDSISKDPTAARVATEAISKPKVLILGGQDDNQDYSQLVSQLIDNKVKKIILIGSTTNSLAAQLGGKVEYAKAQNMSEAVTMSAKSSQAGDAVLLSPGAKSFDMFANYEDRGDQFIEAVRKLK
ncbi:UDP-N-acetylmuramoyl-L-alanine--D-glutamate ligase [Candidatus Saccharibacteria bacterium]|nr:UDP-N-acetylmuramoyl-L-alanine--D-glutamate ligase [Candidatus Saccharibacteria bacterium]